MIGLYQIIHGKRILKRISIQSASMFDKRDGLVEYYICPYISEEFTELLNRIANDENKVVVTTKEQLIELINVLNPLCITQKEMDDVLKYLRSCKDTMMDSLYVNVHVLSYEEIGGVGLHNLYKSKLYNEGYMESNWLLNNKYSFSNWKI